MAERQMHPDSCPLGLFCVDGRCECGGVSLACNGKNSFALQYYCVTFDDEKEVISVGVLCMSSGSDPGGGGGGGAKGAEAPSLQVNEMRNTF